MIQKKSGRPRGFDKEAALMAAVEVFWEKGFDGASLDDLTGAMGINRPSLYNAFGDKRTLFLAALEAYGEKLGQPPLQAFQAEPDIRKAIADFLRVGLEGHIRSETDAKGCMMATCGAMAHGTVEGVDDRMRHGMQHTHDAIVARFEKEKAAGVLPSDFPSPNKARLLVDMMQAQALRARMGEPREVLCSDVDYRIDAVLG